MKTIADLKALIDLAEKLGDQEKADLFRLHKQLIEGKADGHGNVIRSGGKVGSEETVSVGAAAAMRQKHDRR